LEVDPMYSWLMGKMIRLGYRQAIAGRPALLMVLAGDDVELVFPGHNTFAGTFGGKAAVAAWLDRYASLQPTFEISDVVVSGPPWAMRAAVRFHDSIGGDYSNDGMEHLLMRGGRLRRIEIFLDTETVSAWEDRHPEIAATARPPSPAVPMVG
jgi:ketosteroid isomerase-like protein